MNPKTMNDHALEFYPPTTGIPQSAKVLNVFVDGKLICRIGINTSDDPVVLFPTAAFERLDLRESDTIPSDLADLTNVARIDANIDTEGAMPFPVYQRATLAGRAREREIPFDERDRIRDSDPVLQAILDSYVHEPEQSKARTAAITEVIATEFGVKKMAVAGVRAALSRGSYGDFAELLKARRRALLMHQRKMKR